MKPTRKIRTPRTRRRPRSRSERSSLRRVLPSRSPPSTVPSLAMGAASCKSHALFSSSPAGRSASRWPPPFCRQRRSQRRPPRAPKHARRAFPWTASATASSRALQDTAGGSTEAAEEKSLKHFRQHHHDVDLLLEDSRSGERDVVPQLFLDCLGNLPIPRKRVEQAAIDLVETDAGEQPVIFFCAYDNRHHGLNRVVLGVVELHMSWNRNQLLALHLFTIHSNFKGVVHAAPLDFKLVKYPKRSLAS